MRTFLNGRWLYSKGSEFKGRTDNYTLDLYRGKGFVLYKKFLDPSMWDNEIHHDHAGSKTLAKPCSIVIAPPKLPDTSPRLAKAVIRLLEERDSQVKTGDPHPLDLGSPTIHFEVYSSFLIPFNTFRRQ